MKDASVIIPYYQREGNLRNTLSGIGRQTVPPKEVIVVDMGDGIEAQGNFPFPLKIVPLKQKRHHLPLAAARNFGAQLSLTEHLVFLDVDCIPGENFCEKMVEACSQNEALVMGSPRYLLSKWETDASPLRLRQQSIVHPSRPSVCGVEKENCYEMFWSLCFSMPKILFLEMGGFDEGFEGYGAEDTDFALEVKKAGIHFFLSDAEVYHQQHPVYIPPLNHLEPIVNNCNRFHSKWGYWPMTDCLSEFTEMGFIDWAPEAKAPITVKRRPSRQQIQERLVRNVPYR